MNKNLNKRLSAIEVKLKKEKGGESEGQIIRKEIISLIEEQIGTIKHWLMSTVTQRDVAINSVPGKGRRSRRAHTEEQRHAIFALEDVLEIIEKRIL